MSLRSKWKEIKSLSDKISDLKERLGDLDVAHLEREKRCLMKQLEEFDRDVCVYFDIAPGICLHHQYSSSYYC